MSKKCSFCFIRPAALQTPSEDGGMLNSCTRCIRHLVVKLDEDLPIEYTCVFHPRLIGTERIDVIVDDMDSAALRVCKPCKDRVVLGINRERRNDENYNFIK